MYTHEHTEHHTPNTLKIPEDCICAQNPLLEKSGTVLDKVKEEKADGQHTNPLAHRLCSENILYTLICEVKLS